MCFKSSSINRESQEKSNEFNVFGFGSNQKELLKGFEDTIKEKQRETYNEHSAVYERLIETENKE